MTDMAAKRTADPGKLRPDMANMAIHRAVADMDVTVIGAAHDGLAVEHPARLADKGLEDGKFRCSENNRLIRPGNTMA